MSKIVEQLRKHFEEATQEELDKEWEELKHWNEIGPTVDEYLENLKKYGLYPNETDNNSKKGSTHIPQNKNKGRRKTSALRKISKLA